MIQIKRVVEESMPNDRLYFSRVELCKTIERGMVGDGQDHSPLMDALLAIPGVMLTQLSPYSVLISRNPMFEWEEIEAPLLKLLGSFSLQTVKFFDGSSVPIQAK